MDLHLRNRVAFVAGSSRGIGRAIAEAFLAEGCRTVITARDAGALESLRSELALAYGEDRVLACAGDLTVTDAICAALALVRERWGRIDTLVANLGNGQGTPGHSIPAAEWTQMFETNLWGSMRLVTEAMPDMIREASGSVILIASITGIESTAAPIAYSAAKAALVSYAKNLSRTVGPHGVRVNCVAPGNVLFPGGTWERKLAEHGDEVARMLEREVPLRRMGRPDEIADLVVFLASERASFITGACVVADGGQTRST